ncbi:MAG: polysaccharide deacetylase [Desulfarculaceae bacterium]|jgi:peptidoglycan/xylan/chitin deacetylase (PgdA/CDA1 family)
MNKEILIGIGIHVDAVAGWLGSYGGEDSPCDISRGVFAAEVGVPRLLKLLDKYSITASWFIPGHTIETFPSQMKQVVEAGHEVGLHGYSHENPTALSREQEEAILTKCINLIEELSGKHPRGYIAPWWEFSENSVDLLLKYGVKYDSSLMHHDFQAYYVRIGESWTPIDYDKPAETWMKPMDLGTTVDLVELPASWYLDDLPPMLFIKKSPNSHGFVNPRSIEDLWRDQFDYVYREYDHAVFPMCIHPDVSGRPQVILMLERFIEYVTRQPGVRLLPFEEIAADFRKRSPFQA